MRTTAIAHLGGPTLDNDETYLIEKLFAAGLTVCISNEARIGHSSTVPRLGTSFGRSGATMALSDLMNSDVILIMGSNMAENHPVGVQWVIEAKEHGTKITHVALHVLLRPTTKGANASLCEGSCELDSVRSTITDG